MKHRSKSLLDLCENVFIGCEWIMYKACNLCDGDSQVSLQDFEIFFSSRLSKEPEKILPHAGAKRRGFSINSKEELWGNDNDSGERRGVHGTGLKITSHLWLLLDVLRHNPRHPGVRLFIYDRNSLSFLTLFKHVLPKQFAGGRQTLRTSFTCSWTTSPTLQINAEKNFKMKETIKRKWTWE